MNKIKKFLLSKGMYLIAIGCVAVVCLSGLYIAQSLTGNREEPSGTEGPASSTKEAQDVVAVPTRKDQSPAAATPTPGNSASGQNAGTTGSPTGTKAPDSSQTPAATPDTTGANAPAIQLQKPVNGKTLTEYAMDKLVYNKTLDEWRTHSGVDLSADVGMEVKAAADGKVADAKKDPRLGYLIILEHTDGFQTIYANLKEEANVEIGDTVQTGDVIGWVGATAPFEYAEDAHLHFEVLLNDECVNVWTYLS